MGNADANTRAQAYEALISREDDHSRTLVLGALRDRREKDDIVRHRILTAALVKGVRVPAELLGELAATDPSEHIRLKALDALDDQTILKSVAETAQADPSEAIRERANRILEGLKAEIERSNASAKQP